MFLVSFKINVYWEDPKLGWIAQGDLSVHMEGRVYLRELVTVKLPNKPVDRYMGFELDLVQGIKAQRIGEKIN